MESPSKCRIVYVYGHWDGKGLNEIDNKNTVSYEFEYIVKCSERANERESREREAIEQGSRMNDRAGARERTV